MKKRDKKITNWNKAQSAAELAIFGSLILILLGTILTYGQRFDFRQHVKMQAFRKALQEAYYRNASVSYSYKRHSRMMDLFTGFGLGQPKDAQASASVMWVKGVSGVQGDEDQVMHRSFSLYDVNETMLDVPKYPKLVYDRTGADQTAWVPIGVFTEDTERTTRYRGTEEKEETEESIKTRQRGELEDELAFTLHTRFDVSESDERKNPIDVYPTYIEEGTPYAFSDEHFDTGAEGIEGGFRMEQVAEIKDNRIYFRERAPGEATPTVVKDRTWTTSH